jgi:hypothetical protein
VPTLILASSLSNDFTNAVFFSVAAARVAARSVLNTIAPAIMADAITIEPQIVAI